MISALLRIGPLHRLLYAVRIVRLLDQSIRLDANPPARGMCAGDAIILFDARGDSVLDLDPH